MNARQFTSNKDLRVILEAIIDQGWEVRKTKGGHIMAIPPVKDRKIVYMASTPSDRRAIANIVSNLRKSGADL